MPRIDNQSESLRADMNELASLLRPARSAPAGAAATEAPDQKPSAGAGDAEALSADAEPHAAGEDRGGTAERPARTASVQGATGPSASANRISRTRRVSPSPAGRRGAANPESSEASPRDAAARTDGAASGGSAAGGSAGSWRYLGGSRYQKPSGEELQRPNFFIRSDQQRAIGVAKELSTVMGRTKSEVACTALDLVGMNGAQSIPGLKLPDGVFVPDALIEESQWRDLLEVAAQRTGIDGPSPGAGGYHERAGAVLNAVAFMVREALYEAGFGDARRRRGGPTT